MRNRTDASIDAVVTDPPYELGFMGKRWDASGIAYNVDMWRECFRILKPGAHLLAFGGTRTYHRMACAIEDAGFEIRDCIAWVYGAGFPKSLDISKAIDKEMGTERDKECIPYAGSALYRMGGANTRPWMERALQVGYHERSGRKPVTEEAMRWQGWGTALKPAMEPIVVARKPLSEPTVAQNVLKWGTGGLNIDGCRIPGSAGMRIEDKPRNGGVFAGMQTRPYIQRGLAQGKPTRKTYQTPPAGRFPANFVLDEEAAAMLDEMSGITSSRATDRNEDKSHTYLYGWAKGGIHKSGIHYGDSGGASRFYYVAKAPSFERWFYCRDCQNAYPRKEREKHWHGHVNEKGEKTWDHLVEHPTVKPVGLMRWLCRLVNPPGGLVLDPFAGSGSTLVAAQEEGFSAIGIEKEHEYVEIARRRLDNTQLALAV